MSRAGRALAGGAHARVLRVARAFGLAPVIFNPLARNRACWILAVSPMLCVISCLTVIAMMVFSAYGLLHEINDDKESTRLRSITARVVNVANVLAVLVTSAAGVLGAPARARRHLRVLCLLDTVDNTLGYDMVSGKEKRTSIAIVLVLILWTALLADDFILYSDILENVEDRLVNYLAFYLLYYIVVILEIQFAYAAHAIFLRLRRLNAVLASNGKNLFLTKEKPDISTRVSRGIFSIEVKPMVVEIGRMGKMVDELGHSKGSIPASGEPCQESAECMRRLSELHGTLCAAAREVESSFGLPVLIILISTLLHLIVTPYFLMQEMSGSHRAHHLTLQACWCVAHSARLLLLVEPCHRTKREAAKTGDIVGELLSRASAGSGVLRRLELFSRQLLHRTPDFTALGVCSLDRPLISSITAAVTTYLVILIQFQKQDDLDINHHQQQPASTP